MYHVCVYVCVTSYSMDEGIVVGIDSGASQHCLSDITLFHHFDEPDSNVSFSIVAGTMISLHAVCTVKFEAVHTQGNHQIVAVDKVYFVPGSSTAMLQRVNTHCAHSDWEPPDFKRCTCEIFTCVVFQCPQ